MPRPCRCDAARPIDRPVIAAEVKDSDEGGSASVSAGELRFRRVWGLLRVADCVGCGIFLCFAEDDKGERQADGGLNQMTKDRKERGQKRPRRARYQLWSRVHLDQH